MTNKEEILLKEIKKYFNKNKTMPTIRYLQKKLVYKSTNSIFRLLGKLKDKGYLTKNENNKLIINNSLLNYNNNLKKIKIINRKNSYVNIILNYKNDYLAYQINNNYFKKDGIIKNDILVIQINKKISNNEIGLFIINNKYRIMKYNYLDGFYILKDKEEIILNKIKVIGKVILIERKIKLWRIKLQSF